MTAPAIYLASQSPRRQELLRQLGVGFDVLLLREAAGRPRDVDEIARDGEPALHYVERIARTKASVGGAQMLRRGLSPRPVLGADTEVVLDGEIFGKPRDAADATRMLERLSGRTHHVTTAVALFWNDEESAEIVTSEVTFRPLERAEIKRYVATGESADKAGAYAVQGRAAAFVARLEGSYSGVMGLPLYETAALLARIGFPVL
jgi:septum formation protein